MNDKQILGFVGCCIIFGGVVTGYSAYKIHKLNKEVEEFKDIFTDFIENSEIIVDKEVLDGENDID